MYKKLVSLIFIFVLAASFAGCSGENRIDKAYIAEAITVRADGESTVYEFFAVSGGDSSKSVSVNSDSLKNACALAKEKYISDLSLSRLELFIADDNICDKILYGDICYMAENSSVSPNVVVSSCDGGTLDYTSKSSGAFSEIESTIARCRENNPDIQTTVLSIFNHYNSGSSSDFKIAFVTITGELTAESRVIEASDVSK